MIASKTFTGASNDLADGLSLKDMAVAEWPDGDDLLRVFGVGSDHAVTDAKIEAALVLEEGSTKTVLARFRGTVAASSGKSALYDGSATTSRACDVTWDEGDANSIASRLSLIGSFKNNSSRAYWVLGVTSMGGAPAFTSLTLYAMSHRAARR